MPAKRHKYESAREWLDGKIEQAMAEARGGNLNDIQSIVNSLVTHMDDDTIQQEFQSDMENDGFFDNLNVEDDATLAMFQDLLRDHPEATLQDALDHFDEMEDEDYKKYVKKGSGTRADVDTVEANMTDEYERLEKIHAADLDVRLTELMDAADIPKTKEEAAAEIVEATDAPKTPDGKRKPPAKKGGGKKKK